METLEFMLTAVFSWDHEKFTQAKVWCIDAFLIVCFLLFALDYVLSKLPLLVFKAKAVWAALRSPISSIPTGDQDQTPS